jgi:hypothetical protein
MFEIWRHITTGQRYLVVCRENRATAAAGPLPEFQDPVRVLEQHGNQEHNPYALLDMRRSPESYVREYGLDRRGHAIAFRGLREQTDGCSEVAWIHDGAGRTYVLKAADLERLQARQTTLEQLLREGLAEEVGDNGEGWLPPAQANRPPGAAPRSSAAAPVRPRLGRRSAA